MSEGHTCYDQSDIIHFFTNIGQAKSPSVKQIIAFSITILVFHVLHIYMHVHCMENSCTLCSKLQNLCPNMVQTDQTLEAYTLWPQPKCQNETLWRVRVYRERQASTNIFKNLDPRNQIGADNPSQVHCFCMVWLYSETAILFLTTQVKLWFLKWPLSIFVDSSTKLIQCHDDV